LTGSDPFGIEAKVHQQPGIWAFAWCIHFASWLVLPVVFGVLMSAAIRRSEAIRRGELRLSIRRLASYRGIAPEDADAFEQEYFEKQKEVLAKYGLD